MAEITPFQCCVLAILIFGCAVPVVVVAWAFVRINLRLADTNTTQLAAILSLTQAPQATQLAHEIIRGERDALRTTAQSQSVMKRMAGS